MGVLGFSHVQLVVRDVPTSAAWYRAVLGVEEFVAGTITSGPYVGLRHPTGRFVIGLQTATPEQAADLTATSVDHLSFAVADRAELDEAVATLTAQGITSQPLREEVASWNVRFASPDGVTVELTAPKR